MLEEQKIGVDLTHENHASYPNVHGEGMEWPRETRSPDCHHGTKAGMKTPIWEREPSLP
jgi:hypothetical protein